MPPLDLLDQPPWQRETLTLLHFLWQGLAVAALLVAVLWLFRVRRARVRYTLSLLALLGMAACPVVTFAVLEAPTSKTAGAVSTPGPLLPGPAPEPERTISDAKPADERKLHDAPATSGHQPVRGPSPAAWGPAAMRFMRTHQAYLLAGWGAGVALLSVRLLLSVMGLYWLRRGRRPISAELGDCVARLCEQLKLRFKPIVTGSERIREALVAGSLRPVILLPASWLVEMTPEVLEAVIAHELAHIRRFDLWVNVFQRVVETLLFYHPAVWWLSRRVRLEREMCCDELAVATTGRRGVYVDTLELVARKRFAPAKPALASTLGGGKMVLLNRIRYIAGIAPSHERARWWPVGLLTLLVPLAMWLASTSPARPEVAKTAAATERVGAATLLADPVAGIKTVLPEGSVVQKIEDGVAPNRSAREPVLSLVIACRVRTLKAWDEIPIVFTVTNKGTADYTHFDRNRSGGGRMSEYALAAFDEHGNRIPNPRGNEDWDMGGLVVQATLAPRQSFSKTIVLNRWAMVTKPGTYQVIGTYIPERASGRPKGLSAVQSEPITITIQPRSDEEKAKYIEQLSAQLVANVEQISDARQNGPDELVRKLMYTCDPRIVPSLIATMYRDPRRAGWWAREAFKYYLAGDAKVTDALLATASERGMAEEMFDVLRKRGCTPEQLKRPIEVSLSADHPETWLEGARAAMAWGDDRFMPRLIAIATDPGLSARNSPREQAIRALPCNRTDEAVAVLKKLLEDPNPAVRDVTASAIRMAYICRDAEHADTIGRYLRDDDFDAKYRKPPHDGD